MPSTPTYTPIPEVASSVSRAISRLHIFLSAEPHSLGSKPASEATRIPPSQTETVKLALTSLATVPPTMNALRSSSALARRSLATPPAPLSPTSRLISSSSFTSLLSKRSISSTSLSQQTNRVVACSRWSGSIPSSFTQTRTMASEIPKIKVKTPVVELDGDEVWDYPPFYSSTLGSAGFTTPRILVLGLPHFRRKRGESRGILR